MMIWCKPYTTIISHYNSSWSRAVNIKFPWWWTYIFCIVYTCWQIICLLRSNHSLFYFLFSLPYACLYNKMGFLQFGNPFVHGIDTNPFHDFLSLVY